MRKCETISYSGETVTPRCGYTITWAAVPLQVKCGRILRVSMRVERRKRKIDVKVREDSRKEDVRKTLNRMFKENI